MFHTKNPKPNPSMRPLPNLVTRRSACFSPKEERGQTPLVETQGFESAALPAGCQQWYAVRLSLATITAYRNQHTWPWHLLRQTFLALIFGY